MRVSLVMCVPWFGLVLYADGVCVGKEAWFWFWLGIVLGLGGMGCGLL